MSDISNAEVEDVTALTPHDEALYEAGKALLIDSITVSRDFCKFMITLASSAIPIHLGLLKFVLPEHYTLTFLQGVFACIPAGLFLLSSIIFTIGYYPQSGNLSLDVLSEIQAERAKTLKKRRNRTIWGFVIFCIASLAMILTVVYYLMTTN